MVKRESGESPEQTRCCKLNQNPCANTQYPLSRQRRGGKGAQRMSKSENLPKVFNEKVLGDWNN